MERTAYFDNAKFILIFLVVFGHMIQPFVSQSQDLNTLYTWIYTFHMPAFIFLSGFFAKGNGNIQYILKLAKKLVIPYIIFQVLYTAYYFFIGKSNWLTDHIFYPHWSLWFLFSLFCWHLLLILYRKMPPFIGISLAVFLGVIIGYFEQVDHEFSLSRTFVFFPYFLLGYWVSTDQLKLLKKHGIKIASIIIMVIAALIIYFSPVIDIGWLLGSKPYTVLGAEAIGSVARLLVYVTSAIMTMAILSWIPRKRFAFTTLGERTMYVYLLHGFIVQYFREKELLSVESFFDFLGIGLLSAVIVLILSSKLVVTIWQPFIELSAKHLKNWRGREKCNERDVTV